MNEPLKENQFICPNCGGLVTVELDGKGGVSSTGHKSLLPGMKCTSIFDEERDA